jgi:hypothetical protein
MKQLEWQIYGSASSQDYDIMVFVDELGSIEENHQLIKKLDVDMENILELYKYPKKKINVNIGVVRNGQLWDVFKGYVFEVNNSLYHTYKNHNQWYDQHIEEPMKLTADIQHYKLKRCFRFILSFYSRVPEWRQDIKEALRGTFDKRMECFSKIDFTRHTEFPNKAEKREDIYKTFAFQFSQTYLLLHGTEIYSKEEALENFPIFSNFLLRKEITKQDLQHLQNMASLLLAHGKYLIEDMKTLEEIL